MNDCPNCEYHRKRAQLWREEAYKQAGHPLRDCDEPWSPVSIGVDMTEAGAHVVGIYALDKDTSQIFYAKYYPVPQRKPLTDEEIMNIAKVSCIGISPQEDTLNFAKVIEAVHGIKGEA